jgi:energy-coupling factor transporter ATP-binding protein EcfA2
MSDDSSPTDHSTAPAPHQPSAPVPDVLTSAEPVSTGPGATPALRIVGLRKRFGQKVAVDGVDLEVPAGSFYGLVGPNGAGKTTTLSMATGLLRPDAGSIEVDAVDGDLVAEALAQSDDAQRGDGTRPRRHGLGRGRHGRLPCRRVARRDGGGPLVAHAPEPIDRRRRRPPSRG